MTGAPDFVPTAVQKLETGKMTVWSSMMNAFFTVVATDRKLFSIHGLGNVGNLSAPRAVTVFSVYECRIEKLN